MNRTFKHWMKQAEMLEEFQRTIHETVIRGIKRLTTSNAGKYFKEKESYTG